MFRVLGALIALWLHTKLTFEWRYYVIKCTVAFLQEYVHITLKRALYNDKASVDRHIVVKRDILVDTVSSIKQ